jgi:predicted acyl esterase
MHFFLLLISPHVFINILYSFSFLGGFVLWGWASMTGKHILHLRNPWGSYEWKGKWSDTSIFWKSTRTLPINSAMSLPMTEVSGWNTVTSKRSIPESTFAIEIRLRDA